MTDDDDIDAIAGEFVLGTLTADERSEVHLRRARDSVLDTAITAWERRLFPLSTLSRVETPPSNLLEKILARIDERAQVLMNGATVAKLERGLNLWRAAALTASAIAACLALAVGWDHFQPMRKQQNLVAVLQKDAASPAFLVTVNIDDRVMTVQPIAAKAQTGKSYELWLVQQSLGTPKSLGLIDETRAITRPQLAAYQPDVIESATFAVSLEPEGGSPTGVPTGPVVFAGKLLPSAR